MNKYAVALWTGEWVGKQPKWQLISVYDTKQEARVGIRRTRELIELTDETVISDATGHHVDPGHHRNVL